MLLKIYAEFQIHMDRAEKPSRKAKPHIDAARLQYKEPSLNHRIFYPNYIDSLTAVPFFIGEKTKQPYMYGAKSLILGFFHHKSSSLQNTLQLVNCNSVASPNRLWEIWQLWSRGPWPFGKKSGGRRNCLDIYFAFAPRVSPPFSFVG